MNSHKRKTYRQASSRSHSRAYAPESLGVGLMNLYLKEENKKTFQLILRNNQGWFHWMFEVPSNSQKTHHTNIKYAGSNLQRDGRLVYPSTNLSLEREQTEVTESAPV